MRTRRTLYVLLIALASPRRGELEKLRWEDVDLARDTIKVLKGMMGHSSTAMVDHVYG